MQIILGPCKVSSLSNESTQSLVHLLSYFPMSDEDVHEKFGQSTFHATWPKSVGNFFAGWRMHISPSSMQSVIAINKSMHPLVHRMSYLPMSATRMWMKILDKPSFTWYIWNLMGIKTLDNLGCKLIQGSCILLWSNKSTHIWHFPMSVTRMCMENWYNQPSTWHI